MEYVVYSVVTGVGATAVTDLWAILRKHAFGIAPPDYAMVGRWFSHLARGRFRHDSIAGAQSVDGERVIGWALHYAVGIAFAAILLGLWGPAWFRHPTLGPAMMVGVGTVLAPFLLLQPGMGAGVFASRTPRPNVARIQSLVTHAVFGLGLYAAAWLARSCCAP